MATPLAVCAGVTLNVPQGKRLSMVGVLLQVTVQSTPPPEAGSFVTVAVRVAWLFTVNCDGAPPICETVGIGTVMLIVAVTMVLGLVVDAAVKVTASPPEGTVVGAVY